MIGERRRGRFGTRAGHWRWTERVREDDRKEPWFLAANHPNKRGQEYGVSMRDELTLRDCESGGWQWRKSRVRDPARANAVWQVMSAGACLDAESWGDGLRIAEASATGSRTQVDRDERVQSQSADISIPDMRARANPMRFKSADQSKGGGKSVSRQALDGRRLGRGRLRR